MASILFRGTKTFWKTKNSVQVVFLEHGDHNVLEIAAFEPVLCVEAPRIYLKLELVYPLLNFPQEFCKGTEERVSAISTFVFNRLFISKFLPTSKVFEIVVRREFEPIEQKEKFVLMMDHPAKLVPHPSPFTTISSVSIREKWRIPFILVRLLKGLPLQAADQAIYERFAADKSQPELVNAMAVALGTKIQSEEEENLQRIAHSIVLAPQTPFPTPHYTTPSSRTLPEGFVERVQVVDQACRTKRRCAVDSVSPGFPKEHPVVETSSEGEASERSNWRLRNALRLPRAHTSGTLSTMTSSSSSPAGAAHPAHCYPAQSRISPLGSAGLLMPHHQRGHSDGCAFLSQLALVHPDSPALGMMESSESSSTCAVDSVPLSPSRTSIFDALQRRMGFQPSPSSPALLQHGVVEGAKKPPLRGTPAVDLKKMDGEGEGGKGLLCGTCAFNVDACNAEAGDACEVNAKQRDASARLAELRAHRHTFSTEADLQLQQCTAPPRRHNASPSPRSFPGALKPNTKSSDRCSGDAVCGDCIGDGKNSDTSALATPPLAKKSPPPAHMRGGSGGRLAELLGLLKNRVVPAGAWVDTGKDAF